jgi:dienelactone hydrolase
MGNVALQKQRMTHVAASTNSLVSTQRIASAFSRETPGLISPTITLPMQITRSAGRPSRNFLRKLDMAKSFLAHGVFGNNWKRKLAACAGAVCAGLASANGLAQAAVLDPSLNEEIMMVMASPAATVELETTVFKPPGTGPFPLVIMNHGKEPGNPKLQKRDRFLALSREFLKRGYAVVVPMRTGFAHSTGEYSEYNCNMTSNGQVQANDLQNVLNYLRTQSWADKDRILVAGQSYGGLATMAFGTRNFPGVKGLINFAGGLRTEGGCDWQQSLVNAFAEYGGKSTLPSLWFYGENDTYFNHDVARKLHDAYTGNGGNAKLIAYGPFKHDAHAMVGSRDGVKVWWPETEKFLQQLGMPTDEVFALSEPPSIPKSNYAMIDNIDALPYVKDKGREAYRTFLGKSSPRAFAIASNGSWSWAEEGDDPVHRVLANCKKNSGQACKLYAVDDYVVWSDGAPDQLNALSSVGDSAAAAK